MIDKSISDYIIVEISDAHSSSKEDAVRIKCLLGKNNTDSFDEFYANDKRFDTEGEFPYNYVFLHQRSSLTTIIKNIIREKSDKKILFAVHQTGEHLMNVNSAISDKFKKVLFSHESSYPIWSKGLKPMIDSITVSEEYSEEYNKYFRIVCDLIYSPLNEAMNLRAQLLTPLVALDWLTQLHDSGQKIGYEDIINSACDALHHVIHDTKFNHNWTDKEISLPVDILETLTKINHQSWTVNYEELESYADQIESRIQQIRNSAKSV